MRQYWLLAIFVPAVLSFAACTSDALPEPVEPTCTDEDRTYEADIRPIIEQTCAYAGCHLGSAPGVYNDYDGLLSALESGLFRERVISQEANPNVGMPPNYSPDDRQQDLTAEQLSLISCWLEAGFPQE